MEPEANGAYGAPAEPSEVALVSIAISLKRIADMMGEVNEYGEGPAAAIGGALARNLKSNQPT
jgi:hypothetical protein